jgi:hypothetical protein
MTPTTSTILTSDHDRSIAVVVAVFAGAAVVGASPGALGD